VTRRYAVLWSDGAAVRSGRLETYRDRIELHGRDGAVTLPFDAVADAAIARGHEDRLRGLPVLVVRLQDGSCLRVASLDGPGVLHELARHPGLAPIAVS
jgi:hypothetical protein